MSIQTDQITHFQYFSQVQRFLEQSWCRYSDESFHARYQTQVLLQECALYCYLLDHQLRADFIGFQTQSTTAPRLLSKDPHSGFT